MMSFSAPSMRKRIRTQSSAGSTCTSDARSRSACVTILLTTCTIGAFGSTTASSSSCRRSSTTSLAWNASMSKPTADSALVRLVDAEAQHLRRARARGAPPAPAANATARVASGESGLTIATVSAPSAKNNGSTSKRCASVASINAVACSSGLASRRSTIGIWSCSLSARVMSPSVTKPRSTSTSPTRSWSRRVETAFSTAARVARPASTTMSPSRARRSSAFNVGNQDGGSGRDDGRDASSLNRGASS